MKVLVTANTVPFVRRSGKSHRRAGSASGTGGCRSGLCTLPLPLFAPGRHLPAMAFCAAQDFNQPNGVRIDKVISLQFPALRGKYNDLRVWVMHQHRAVYELYAAGAQ